MPIGIYKHKPLSTEHKLKISQSMKGKVVSNETRIKLSIANKGKTYSPKSLFRKGHIQSSEVREKISAIHKGKPAKWITSPYAEIIGNKISETKRGIPSINQRGEKHYNWKGGISSENMKVRSSLEYTLWRRAVFQRDNYQCIWGGKEHGNKLEADHIKSFAHYPELRFAIDNGRTLCQKCHSTTDNYKGKSNRKIK